MTPVVVETPKTGVVAPAIGAGPVREIVTLPAAAKPDTKAQAPLPVRATDDNIETLAPFTDADKYPALKHVAGTGATLLDLGMAHGLHVIAAKAGNQFMILQLAPDGEALVGGPAMELSEARLRAIGGDKITQIGESHGLSGLFVRNGQEFQVLYVTPDKQAAIAGVMWDEAGKNLTRQQVAKIDGALPTVEVSDVKKVLGNNTGPIDDLATVQHAAFGAFGADDAPLVWMIVDPACSYSIRAFSALKPFIEAGRVRVNIVPISILDHEDNGVSTKAALSLLSVPPESMAMAWEQRKFGAPLSETAEGQLQGNGQIAEMIKLTGTPTFLFRKPDGSKGQLDGMPTDMNALVAQVGRS